MRQNLNSQPALTALSPTLKTVFPANIFPNKVTPNVSNNISRNLPFYSFASLVIVLLTPFVYNAESLRNLTISIMQFISSLGIMTIVPDPRILFLIAESVANAFVFNPKGTIRLLH